MITNIKWILIGIVLLGFIALFIWGDKIPTGSIFAGLAAFIAAIKSRLFGIDKAAEKINLIKNTHQITRRNWEIEKEEYDLRISSIRSRMDSLTNRIEDLNEQLDKVSKPEYKARLRSEEEILNWLKNN